MFYDELPISIETAETRLSSLDQVHRRPFLANFPVGLTNACQMMPTLKVYGNWLTRAHMSMAADGKAKKNYHTSLAHIAQDLL